MRPWFELLPDQVFQARPVLSVGYVGTLMATGEFADVEVLLRGAERWLEPASERVRTSTTCPRRWSSSTKPSSPRLPSAVALYRAAQAQLEGDRERTEAFAHQAFDLAGDDDPLGRGAAAGFLALAHWGSGDLEAAHGFWAEAMASLQRAGHAVDAIGCNRPLAEIRAAQGRLHEAMRTYERGLRMATDGTTVLRGAGDMHVGMSELLLEWNDLDAAAGHLRQSDDLGDNAGLAQNPYRWRVAKAQLRLADGDADGALALLADAERVFVSEYYPLVRPIPAQMRGSTPRGGHCARPKPGCASAVCQWTTTSATWASTSTSPSRGCSWLAGPGSMIRARSNKPSHFSSGCSSPPKRAGGGGVSSRSSSCRRWLSTSAVAARQGSSRSVEHLPPAEPEGYVRSFVGEGAPMAEMLAVAAKRDITPEYVRRLLGAFGRIGRPSGDGQSLVEPLSERELDVLRLLASDLDGPGIADELVVGLSTVRTHTKSIYAKLGVNSRRAAVRRGEELGLLSRVGDR